MLSWRATSIAVAFGLLLVILSPATAHAHGSCWGFASDIDPGFNRPSGYGRGFCNGLPPHDRLAIRVWLEHRSQGASNWDVRDAETLSVYGKNETPRVTVSTIAATCDTLADFWRIHVVYVRAFKNGVQVHNVEHIYGNQWAGLCT